MRRTLSPSGRSRKLARNQAVARGFRRWMIERFYLAAVSAIVALLVRIALDP